MSFIGYSTSCKQLQEIDQTSNWKCFISLEIKSQVNGSLVTKRTNDMIFAYLEITVSILHICLEYILKVH